MQCPKKTFEYYQENRPKNTALSIYTYPPRIVAIIKRPIPFQIVPASQAGLLNQNLHLMKLTILTALSATILLATSCGISDKEKTALLQAQQAKDDSIRVAQIKQVKDEEALKSALGDSLSAYNNLLLRQQNALIQLRTEIYTANDEMTQIKSFHFGRMPQDKENQIRNQELKIQTLIMTQTNLVSAIEHSAETIRAIRTELAISK
jgi:hypothetical protein